ncbi:uncharacterized protein EV420DRAFT_818035 [Desarmillaria tabescens]|uniref:DH domain-containing protein n=1 Tax=Armillaria tabescens TaxID=1929756 RepID=A0AA39NIH6_ARMTA|nr:uncharacterized protein EV420DRAFT_818035 [Desarmillaria tabescens]KAK0466250.1 hypothetical protein EV420DRAFT_818035 [Desarmillaria tabescens]
MSDECSTAPTLVDSSDLSTPELSPPASDSESSNDGAFFSALSSSDETPDVMTDISVHISSKTKSPIALEFPTMNIQYTSPEKVFRVGKNTRPRVPPRRPAPLPLVDSLPSSPTYSRPRKLQKPRRTFSDSDDSAPSSPSFFSRPVGLLRRATGYAPIKPSYRTRRSSLPSIPSASTFPIHNHNVRTRANERAVKFQSPLHENSRCSHRRRARSPYPNRNASTDALVSLAWTGEFPSSASVNAKSSMGDTFFYSSMGIATTSLKNGWKSTWSFSGERADDWDDTTEDNDMVVMSPPVAVPLLSPQYRGEPTKGHRRRWTLAMAITDDGISDEMLMDELERMRTVEKMWQWEWRRNVMTPSTTSTVSTADPRMPLIDASHDEHATLKPSLPCLSDPALSAVWQSARRALLICREFVRTERHYLLAIRRLSSGDTLTSPPALMLTYLPALLEASEELLKGLEANPSAQGVANAFLSCEDKLDAALVGWCGVVGGFFVGADEGVAKRERASSATTRKVDADAANSTIKRRVNSWGKRINSFKALGGSAPPTPSLESTKLPSKRERGRPSVRDLAILPTQRVMRYTLLFKDLYSHTPVGNSSRDGVEKAMSAAISLAQKCDRAQGNAAFLHKPTKNK